MSTSWVVSAGPQYPRESLLYKLYKYVLSVESVLVLLYLHIIFKGKFAIKYTQFVPIVTLLCFRICLCVVPAGFCDSQLDAYPSLAYKG